MNISCHTPTKSSISRRRGSSEQKQATGVHLRHEQRRRRLWRAQAQHQRPAVAAHRRRILLPGRTTCEGFECMLRPLPSNQQRTPLTCVSLQGRYFLSSDPSFESLQLILKCLRVLATARMSTKTLT